MEFRSPRLTKPMKRTKKSKAPPIAPKAAAVAESRPAPVVRSDYVYTYLRIGDVVELNGIEYVVDYINECRAHAIPLSRKHVSYKTVAGKKVEFEVDHSGKNISPNSEIPILRRLGTDWREKSKSNSKP